MKNAMMPMPLTRTGAGVWLYFTCILLVWAATTYADFLHDLATRESGMRPGIVNDAGYVGLFQMGELALIDAGYYQRDGTGRNDWKGAFTGKDGVTSLSGFLANPNTQIQALTSYYGKSWQVIQNLGLDSYLGRTINGVQITQSGLIAGAHLVGYAGLRDYLQSNGSIIPHDGNGTPISQYIQQFGGYTIGSTAPTYATVLGAAGSTGLPSTGAVVSSAPTGGVNAGTHLPIAPTASGISSDEAFYNYTGYSESNVADTIKLLVAASLFIWLVWTILGVWTTFHEGGMPLLQLKTDVIRAVIVMMIGIMLLT